MSGATVVVMLETASIKGVTKQSNAVTSNAVTSNEKTSNGMKIQEVKKIKK